jgi:sporulation protein YlmC with PRC-barrel domain
MREQGGDPMMKQLMTGAAIGALMVSGALAQAPSPPSSSTPPAAAQSQPATAQSQQGAGKADIVASQKPDQWLATKFKGTEVDSADNQKIGTIKDILFDKSGKIEAYVVSVGGFLGVGSKEVAVAPTSFEVIKGEKGSADKLKIAMSQEELKQAQNFTPYAPPRPTTTGSGAPAGLNGLSSGGTHPSSNRAPSSSK